MDLGEMKAKGKRKREGPDGSFPFKAGWLRLLRGEAARD
jgi:hypothetical protein